MTANYLYSALNGDVPAQAKDSEKKGIIVTSFVSFLNRLHDEKAAAKRNAVSSVESTLHNAHRGGSRRCKKRWENEQRARKKMKPRLDTLFYRVLYAMAYYKRLEIVIIT